MKIKIQDFKTQSLIIQTEQLNHVPCIGTEVVFNDRQYEVKYIRYNLDSSIISVYVEQFN